MFFFTFPFAFIDNLMECIHGRVERVPPASLAELVEGDETSMSDEIDELLIEIDNFQMGNSDDDDDETGSFWSETPPFASPPPPPLQWPLFPCDFIDNLMECIHWRVEGVRPVELPSDEEFFKALLQVHVEEYPKEPISSSLAELVEGDETSMSDEIDELLIEIDKFQMGNSDDDDDDERGSFWSETPPFASPPPPPLPWPLFPCAFIENLMECNHERIEPVPPVELPSDEDFFKALNLGESDEIDQLLIEIDKFRMGNSEDDDGGDDDEGDGFLSETHENEEDFMGATSLQPNI